MAVWQLGYSNPQKGKSGTVIPSPEGNHFQIHIESTPEQSTTFSPSLRKYPLEDFSSAVVLQLASVQAFNLPGVDPDSNFSLQQDCNKFEMTRVQACDKFDMTRVQACNEFETS
ncbi:hypothetical protein AVEN_226644-1 [Araneus ventricosus]|uniref:Uncharacterized protein n=1 Tax=Araneus ventricosus TaxID=182803 RepID=A0A4Y2SRM3_ARAVE|nr:hypothetical protein AVEN_226644-1 [Araneus ventricosus]